MNRTWLVAVGAYFLAPNNAALAAAALDGKSMSLVWILPFVGLLLCMATGPLLFHRLWEEHYGKFAAFWAMLTIAALAVSFSSATALESVLHAMLVEFLPFIVLLFTLYTVAGGVLLIGKLHGSPVVNTGLLALGTLVASVIGTTGASMILIRPLIRANSDRAFNTHVVVFFIFLVSNIGGSLSPLGDPPLFVGYLRGVEFFWVTTHLLVPTATLAGILLLAFFALDTYLGRNERADAFSVPHHVQHHPQPEGLKIYGYLNIGLFGAIIAVILLSARWQPGITIDLPGAHLPLQNIVRDVALLLIAAASWFLTPMPYRAGNEFSWGPILEVAKLFVGIFICVIPVLVILQAGHEGALRGLVALVTRADGQPEPLIYYGLTGLLSAFLDNAPTYLVFFEMAGGNPGTLMGPLAPVLVAISAGAVYMGAITYIGNAPNLMVAAIAKDMKVKMPGFIGYMGWSCGILAPALLLIGLLYMR